VLDVGCGNGYHCWRMLGAGAAEVIGVDPTPLFVLQFKALQYYMQQQCIHVLPVTLEAMPEHLPVFDTVFSMGVLYHRRNPMEHLVSLRNKLAPEGQLVLETLVIEGDENALLEPNGRYARMGNVWQLPSPGLAARWLAQAGFSQVEIIDVRQTSLEEQRRTPWMTFHSLAQFLDPHDPGLTIEGLPAPRRAILTAELRP
jgi:tRNA (mo5U34)-methyltransferase